MAGSPVVPLSARRDPPYVEQRPEPDVVEWEHTETGLEAAVMTRRFPVSMETPDCSRYEEWQQFVVRESDAVVYREEFRELEFERAVERAREWLALRPDGTVRDALASGVEVSSGP